MCAKRRVSSAHYVVLTVRTRTQASDRHGVLISRSGLDLIFRSNLTTFGDTSSPILSAATTSGLSRRHAKLKAWHEDKWVPSVLHAWSVTTLGKSSPCLCLVCVGLEAKIIFSVKENWLENTWYFLFIGTYEVKVWACKCGQNLHKCVKDTMVQTCTAKDPASSQGWG